jgi:hypothetical protein
VVCHIPTISHNFPQFPVMFHNVPQFFGVLRTTNSTPPPSGDLPPITQPVQSSGNSSCLSPDAADAPLNASESVPHFIHSSVPLLPDLWSIVLRTPLVALRMADEK